MNKSVFVKTCSVLFTASLVVGALSYSQDRFAPKKVDFSAFKNASANIQFLTENTSNGQASEAVDVTSGIVKSIESEVKRKIQRTRYAVTPKKIEYKTSVVAKNWNDIKPKFDVVDMKLDKAKLMAVSSNDEISEFEINNKELLNLYRYEFENLKYETFSNVEIASYNEVKSEDSVVAEYSAPVEADDLNTQAEDVVNVAQASTQTTIKDEIVPTTEETETYNVATTENAVNDDLVMFDYSDKPAAATVVEAAPKLKKIFDAPLSNSVKEVIERELGKSPKKKSSNAVTTQVVPNNTNKFADSTDIDLDKIMEDADTVVYDYSKQRQSAVVKKEDEMKAAFNAFAAPDTTTQIEFTLKALEVNMNTQKVRPTFGFEFVPDYDRADRMDDQTSGEIKFGYSLSGDVNTQTGVVQSQGMIPTRVELHLMNEGINVPLINEEAIQKFLQKKGLDIVGNLLMTAIDPSISDVEIDSDYQAKIYFSDKFKVVKDQDNAAYLMFLGVKNGNVLLRYLLDNKETAQKIVYVGEGEMYFEDPDFVGTQRELYTFTTRSLLGKKVKELNIDGSDISFFGTKIMSKKKTLNSYEVKVPELVENSRKYLEFKHMGQSLFVGTSNTKEIEIPGNDFIGRVMQANELSELGQRCMVQINLTKDLRDFKVSGKNRSGEMFAETSFLDNDGNFSRDNSELSEKVFVTGDLEGLFNIRLDYTDGTVDFLKTYCSEGSYLIEQL